MEQNRLIPFKSNDLHRQLAGARYWGAISTPETMATIMGTVLVTLYIWLNGSVFPLPHWIGIAAPIFGFALSAFLIAIGLTDPDIAARSVKQALEEHFHLDQVADENIRSQINQAVEHRVHLQRIIQANNREMRNRVAGSFAAIDVWLVGMGTLIDALLPFQVEAGRQSESKLRLKARISELEQRIDETSDKRIKDQLRETIAGRRQQRRAVAELESLIERGLLRLERSVSALGAINAQFAILSVQGEQDGWAASLADDINSEIQEIDAILVAIDRVHSSATSQLGDETTFDPVPTNKELSHD